MNPPLLLLHGALGSAAQFDALRPHLPAGQKVWAPNFPGHGGLPTDTEFSIAAFADSTLAFLQAQQSGPVDIFGYSMGGYVGLYLAWKHPEWVRQLWTLGTKFDWTPETAARETSRLDPAKIAAKVPAFAQALAERHAPADWQDLLRRTAGLLTNLGAAPPLGPAAFAAIACPVRIGLGDADQMVSREESEHTAGLLRQGVFEVLPATPHPFEQVDARGLAKWLQSA
ncbi:MAG: alpha/beta fold hydrolase [Saprospiraceae bacterium]|nr:alpha/beta fold hydrolase [Saprospiraceae bacterium]